MAQNESRAPKMTFSFDALMRALRYMLKNYGALFCFVVVCIAFSAFAINRSMLFTQILIDDYIEPMLVSGSTDFSGLAAEIVKLGVILVIGVLASWGFNRLMVTISQGTMRNLREEVFEHMEALPLRFFDTHQHGDIMSVYTNDIDTLRQFYGQTLPQLVNSTITLVVTFTTMVALSMPLTAISVVMVVIMLVVMGRVSGFAGSFFAQQQTDLGAVDGYIEEMMDGQKVVKVFNHEADASAGFRRVNDRLRESSKRANLISNLADLGALDRYNEVLAEVPRESVEAVEACGASTPRIVFSALLPEALPSIVRGVAVVLISVLGYTAIAGAVGAGGLGDIAIRYGYYRYQSDVMLAAVIILVVIVQVIQSLCDFLARKSDHRSAHS